MGPEKGVLATLSALLISIAGNAWYVIQDGQAPANPSVVPVDIRVPLSCHCRDNTPWAPLFAVAAVSLSAGILVGVSCCAAVYYCFLLRATPAPKAPAAEPVARESAKAPAAEPAARESVKAPPPLPVVDGGSL